MKFYLGTHMLSQPWWDLGLPLFVSRVRLEQRRQLPKPAAGWALDSGAYTELDRHGGWRMTAREYADLVGRFREMGHLEWAAPQDWMCEPHVLARTGLTIQQHQARTVFNFLGLRHRLGDLVIPVLQGWERDDYLRCAELYETAGVDLMQEHTVGLGTVCRRQNTAEAGKIVRALKGLRLHAFGVKITGLASFGDAIVSADSMAWSYAGRHDRLTGCSHKNCANCIRYAVRWYERVLAGLAQQRLEVAA